MKRTFVTLLLALLSVQVQCAKIENVEHMSNFFKATGCLEKEDLTLEEVLKFTTDQSVIAQKMQEHPKLKCFTSCIFEYAKFMDGCTVAPKLGNGDEDEMLKEIEACRSSVTATDRCECGYQMAKCMLELSA